MARLSGHRGAHLQSRLLPLEVLVLRFQLLRLMLRRRDLGLPRLDLHAVGPSKRSPSLAGLAYKGPHLARQLYCSLRKSKPAGAEERGGPWLRRSGQPTELPICWPQPRAAQPAAPYETPPSCDQSPSPLPP